MDGVCDAMGAVEGEDEPAAAPHPVTKKAAARIPMCLATNGIEYFLHGIGSVIQKRQCSFEGYRLMGARVD